MTLEEYLKLIPAHNREKPKFIAMVTTFIEPLVYFQSLLDDLIPRFDVDTARGFFLDAIGKWVGVSREVSISGVDVYFSWDEDYSVGWDYSFWAPDPVPVDVTVLPDEAYRTLIKAKIAANTWDGTTDGAYEIWDTLFSDSTILIIDYQNMSYDLAFIGGIIDSLTVALAVGGYIPLKPEGVRVNNYLFAYDAGPVFSWDMDSDLMSGWDEGSWAREYAPT